MVPAAGHAKEGHPECPQRIAAIERALAASGLGAHPAARALAPRELAAWQDRGKLLDALQLVHPRAYLDRLDSICSGLAAPTMVDESTYIAGGSYSASLETAAALLSCLDAVLPEEGGGAHADGGSSSRSGGGGGGGGGGGSEAGSGGSRVAFCLGRPPGHHVLSSRPMGFGLINCISAAAALALRRRGVARAMVLDWDVHHGNGTEALFYNSPSVMYVSTHQQGIFPMTGKASQVGSGEGAGTTVNVPLPAGAGDAAMAMAWDRIVLPAARRFRPDILIVSSGYDAHWADPLAGLQFCSSTYHWLSQRARGLADELCGGRCVFVLEGGYHQPSLGESVAESFRGLLGLPAATPPAAELAAQRRLLEEPLGKVERALAEAARVHSLG